MGVRVFVPSSAVGDGAGPVVVAAVEDLDLAVEAAARAELVTLLERFPGETVVIDCSDVFVALRGLRLLAEVGEMARIGGGSASVVGPLWLRRIVELSGLPLVLHLSVQDALAAALALD